VSQLGKLEFTVIDDNGNPVLGASIDVYLEGATVNGNQSSAAPFDVAVWSSGKIRRIGLERVRIGTGTTDYVVVTASVTDTNVRLVGFAGTLSLGNNDRLIPSRNRPSCYLDDQGGQLLPSQTLTTDANGYAFCFVRAGTYEGVVSGSGIISYLVTSQVTVPEAPFEIRYADSFVDMNSSTGGVLEAMQDLASTGGKVVAGPKSYAIGSKLPAYSNVWIEGQGPGLTTFVLGYDGTLLENSDTVNGNPNIRISGITFDGNNFGTSTSSPLVHMKRTDNLRVHDCEFKNCRADALLVDADASCKRISIRDNKLTEVMTAVTGNGHAGIYVNATNAAITQVEIVGNTVENAATATGTTGISVPAIAVNGSNATSTVIGQNVINNCWSNGIYVGPCQRTVVSGNIVTNFGQQNVLNGGNGIFCTGSGKTTITGNIIDTGPANSDNGIEVSGTGSADVTVSGNYVQGVMNLGKAGIGFGSGLARITCTANIVSGNLGGGIFAKEASGTARSSLVITGNLCDSNVGSHGMDIRGYTNVTVSGNVCRFNGFAGINFAEGVTVSGAEATTACISGNVCTLNGLEGISVLGEVVAAAGQLARRVSVTGNTSYNNTGDGMRLWDVSGLTIVGNNVSLNGGDGIELGGSAITDVVVNDNIIRDNTGVGLKNAASSTTRLSVGQSNILQNNAGGNASANIGTPTLSGATPSVVGVSRALMTNGGATNVTDFTNGWDGQTVTIHFTDGNSTLVDGTNIFLTGSINKTFAATDHCTLTRVASKWYEDGRSIN